MNDRVCGYELISMPGRVPSKANELTSGSYPEYFVTMNGFFTDAYTLILENPIFWIFFLGKLYPSVMSEQRR